MEGGRIVPIGGIYFIEGYMYILNKMERNITYLICRNHKKKNCPGRGKINRNNQFILTSNHKHTVDPREEEEFSLRRELRNSARTQPDSLRDVYNNIMDLHNEQEGNISFTRMKENMRRWRYSHVPEEIDNLLVFTDTINSDEWGFLKSHKSGVLSYYLSTGEDNASCCTIFDNNFPRSAFRAENYFIHISKKCIPQGGWTDGIISLLMLKNNRLIPIALGLLERLTIETYKSFFLKIKEIVPIFQMTTVVTGNEVILKESIEFVFPEANVLRSLYYYQEDIYKKFVAENLKMELKNNDNNNEIKKLALGLMALPLFPAELIEYTYDNFLNTLSQLTITRCNNILDWFQTEWLQGVQTENMTCYNNYNQSTQFFELYSNQLESKLGTFPATWRYPRFLSSYFHKIKTDLRNIRVEDYQNVRMPKLFSREKRTDLKTLWSNMNDDSFSGEDLLNQARNMFSKPISFYFEMEHNNEDGNDNYFDVINVPEPVVELVQQNPQEVVAEVLEEERNDEPQVERPLCCVCYTRAPEYIFIPCAHLKIYEICWIQYQVLGRGQCPMCRARYTNVYKVF
ncbi:uncharacterized protein LOC122503419 [Leptopilina heterotoma]|uniref:uncharacterized protein LOC122503419 n=1 Tax=Leptopilina heterotoma TaxID=63436 RepID=UPI001CA90FF2|nr:uncharacterized protein LOC122503419 [Leptopilina heterotoma]